MNNTTILEYINAISGIKLNISAEIETKLGQNSLSGTSFSRICRKN